MRDSEFMAPSTGDILNPSDPGAIAPDPTATGAGAGRARFIVFAHSSGGAGATTLAVNAALLLAAAKGRRVCLLDLDFQFGTVDLHLNLTARSQIADLGSRPERLDDQMLETMMVDGPEGIRVLTAPESVVPLEVLAPDTIGSILDIVSRRYDDVVIDLPVALTSWTGKVLEAADRIFLVTQISVIALRTARHLLDTLMAEGLRRNRISVVASRHSVGRGGAKVTLRRAGEVLGLPVSARIPSQYQFITECLDYGVPATVVDPHSRYSRAVSAMLAVVDTEDGATTSPLGRSLFGLWRSRHV